MKASELLPLTFSMGWFTLLMYHLTGSEIWLGQNITYLAVTVFILAVSWPTTRRTRA